MKPFIQMLLCAMMVCFCFSFPVRALEAAGIASKTAVLMDAETGQVLYNKDMDQRMYPASTTKIMTCLLVTELCDLGEIVTVSGTAVDIDEWDSASADLVPGEKLTVDELLCALMLPSANDAANALAEHAAGSQKRFVDLMNRRAVLMGATGTHFTNAHGLHDPAHYTTAHDMALITRQASKSPSFMRYFGAKEATIGATNLQPVEREYFNYQSMLLEDSAWYDPSVLGGKIGFTNEAQHTMSTVAGRDGRDLICVVMHSEERTEKFTDTAALLEYGFGEFRRITLPAAVFDIGSVPLGEDGMVTFQSETDFTALLRSDLDESNIEIGLPQADRLTDNDTIPTSVEIRIETDDDTLPALLGTQPLVSTIQFNSLHASATRVFSMPDDIRALTLSPQHIVFFLITAVATLLLLPTVTRLICRERRRRARMQAFNRRVRDRMSW